MPYVRLALISEDEPEILDTTWLGSVPAVEEGILLGDEKLSTLYAVTEVIHLGHRGPPSDTSEDPVAEVHVIQLVEKVQRLNGVVVLPEPKEG